MVFVDTGFILQLEFCGFLGGGQVGGGSRLSGVRVRARSMASVFQETLVNPLRSTHGR